MKGYKRLVRCNKCEPCVRDSCGDCVNCLDSPRFGGPNVRRQACQFKKCANPTRSRKGGGASEEEEKKSKRQTRVFWDNRTTATNVNNREMMYLISKIEILVDDNDDLAKKLADNSKMIRRDLAAVKKQISLFKQKVAAPKHQIRSLERRMDISYRDDSPRINDHGIQVIKDRHIDEERNPANDIEEERGSDNREEVISHDDIRDMRTGDDNLRHAGIIEDDLVLADTSCVDDAREIGIDHNDNMEVGTSNDDARGGDFIIPLDESNQVEVDSEQPVDNDKNEKDEIYSRLSEAALRQILEFSIETIEKSDKILECLRKEVKEMERQSGQGCSPEWMELMEKKIALVNKKMSVNKGIKKKMELKTRCVQRELEKRNILTKKKIIETRCRNNNVSSNSTQRLKRKLNESVESVIDCGMIRKVSAKEEGVMVMRELMKEENPCDDTFECNFCPKVFTSAGPLTAHLLNHTSGNNKHQRLDCPWPACSYANTHQNLTKHIRSIHTKEELFRCVQCPKKFHTMDTKLIHEKKHWQQNEWDQCDHCLRFYKSVRGSCSFCQKKY